MQNKQNNNNKYKIKQNKNNFSFICIENYEQFVQIKWNLGIQSMIYFFITI